MAQTYPLLKWKEIIINLEKMIPELKIRPQDYQEPDKDFWLRAYQFLLPKILDVPYEELFPPNLHIRHNMEEYYENSLILKYTFRHMQTAMNICKYNEFNLRDCLYPNKSHLQDILSASINYIIFKETKVEFVQNIIRERELKLKEIESLRIKTAELLKMKDDIISDMKDYDEEQIDKEIASARKALQDQMKIAEDHKLEYSKIQNDIKKKLCEKDNLDANIAELTRKSLEYDNLICLSPEQMVQEIEDLRNQVEKLDIEIASFPERLSKLQKRVDTYSTLYKYIPKFINIRDSLINADSKRKKFEEKLQMMEAGMPESSVERLKAELQNKKLIREELQLYIKNCEFNKKEYDDELIKILKDEKKFQEMKEDITNFTNEYDILKNEYELTESKTNQELDSLVMQQAEIYKLFEEKKKIVDEALEYICEKLKSIIDHF